MARCFLVACRINRCLYPSRYGNQIFGLTCLLISAAFFFLEETGFRRDEESEPLPQRPSSFMSNRIATFFPGTAVVPRTTVAHVVSPLAISSSWFLTDVVGQTLHYAVQDWLLTCNHDSRSLRRVHLWVRCRIRHSRLHLPPNARNGRRLRLHAETKRRMWVTFEEPVSARMLMLNHLVNFAQWAGLALCQICGAFLNDRVPLWISRRRGGAWHLEYRLYPILLVAAASPIGFGIFGAGVQCVIASPPAPIKVPS